MEAPAVGTQAPSSSTSSGAAPIPRVRRSARASPGDAPSQCLRLITRLASRRSAKTRRLTPGQEGRGQLRGTAALPCRSEADPLESVVLITVYDYFRAPGHFQGEHGPVNVVGGNRACRGPQASLLVQLTGHARRQVLTWLARAGRRSPRPVTLPGRTAMMRAVQEQVPPPLRSTAGNHRRRPMRALTTDRLTIPGSELPRTAEVSHGAILAALATVGYRQVAQSAPRMRREATRGQAGQYPGVRPRQASP
jgi:hypothetical protein